MDIQEAKKRIMDFMQANILTIISTVDISANKPESAVIAFAQKDNFELIFGTPNTTRKYRNLQKNPNVSFVIGWDSDTGTVQYEGIAKELFGKESKLHSSVLVSKNPRSQKFVNREYQRYFLVKPTWIRILDMTKNPDETFEISF